MPLPLELDLNRTEIMNYNKEQGAIGLKVYVANAVPAGNYMFKVNNRNSRTRCKICLKLTKKTPERL